MSVSAAEEEKVGWRWKKGVLVTWLMCDLEERVGSMTMRRFSVEGGSD